MPFWRLFYHFVWSTHGREPVIDVGLADVIERSVRSSCREQGVLVLAVGVMPDHIHVAASIPPAVSIASVVGRWKGSSSHLVNHGDGATSLARFRWQPEYGVLSFGEKALPDVRAYIGNQATRHAERRLWSALELTETDLEPVTPALSVECGSSGPPCGS